MADRNEVIRIILEARDNLSSVFRRALGDADKEVKKFQGSLKDLEKDVDLVFTRSGFRGRDPLTGRFVALSRGLKKTIEDTRGAREDYREILDDVRRAGDEFVAALERKSVELERRPLFTTFFDRQRDSARRAILALREFRREAQVEFATRQRGPVGEIFGGFVAARQEARLIDEAVRKRIAGTKEEIELRRRALEEEIIQERGALRKEFFAKKQDLEQRLGTERQGLDNRIRIERQAANELARLREQITRRNAIIQADLNDRTLQLTNIEKNILNERLRANREEIDVLRIREQVIRDEISLELDKRNAAERAERKSLEEEARVERELAAITERERRTAITRPNIFDVRREETERIISQLDRIDNRLKRIGVSAGRAWGDFRTGITAGRRGLSDLERQTLSSERRLTRFGAAIGIAVAGASSFVNVRWAIVISFLQILGTLIVQGGTALVALASSLVLAASALGGAFLPAIAQAIPAVGLLVAAFQRLGAVIDASNLAEKLRLSTETDAEERVNRLTEATQRLSDARYAARLAAEAIGDAEFNLLESGRAVRDAYERQREAIQDLADARKQAAQDIVDANLEEREAALALEEAELAVLDAKRRLREERQRDIQQEQDINQARANVREAQARLEQVRREGDQAEISTAIQNLSIAEQNLQAINNQIDESENRIKDAELGIQRSEINLEQARIRDERAQEDATRLRREGVENSERVILAQKSLETATRGIANAQRQQVLATRAVRDAIHAAAVASREETDARRAAADATSDQTAAQKNLQEALADLSPAETRLFRSIERIRERYREIFRPITDIIVSAFARAVDRALIILEDPKLQNAARVLAGAIANAIDVISRFTITPEFRKFLEFSIQEAAKNIPILTRTFLNLFRIFMRIGQGAAPLLTRLFERFERFTERLEERSRNREGIERFFSTAERHLDSWLAFIVATGKLLGIIIKLSAPSGRTLLDSLTDKFNEWTRWMDENEDRVTTFFENIIVDVQALARSLGFALEVLFEAFSSEEASALTQFILEVFIPAFKLFLDILGLAAKGFLTLTKIPVIGELFRLFAILVVTEKLFNRLIPITQKFTNLLFALLTGGFNKFTNVLIREFPIAAKIFQEALLRIQILFINLGRAIQTTTLYQTIFNKAVLANPYVRAAVAIAALIAILVGLELKFQFVTKTVRALENVFRATFNWIRQNWKLLGAIIAAPFVGTALLIIRFKDNIINAAKLVVDFFTSRWRIFLSDAILAPFKEIPVDAYNFGRDLIQGLIDGIKSKANDFKDRVIEIVKSPWEVVKSFFGIFSPSQWTKENIGIPLAEGITEGAKEGLRGTGNELTLALRNELRSVETEARSVRDRMLSQIGQLRTVISAQLGLKLQELTPAEKELQKLDLEEAERSRKQQLAEAADTVKQAQLEVDKANREVIKKQKALNNAKTLEQKRQAKEELKFAKQNLDDAHKQLVDARNREKETERQISVDRRRERLNQLAQEQREALEKSVAAEQNRANKLIDAFVNTLKGEPNKFKIQKARSILDEILGLIGGGEKGGKRAANEYVAGFLEEFNKFKRQLEKEEKAVIRKGEVLAQQNRIAGELLAESTQQPLIGAVKQPKRGEPKTDLEALKFLIATGNIDIALAEAIVGITSDVVDQRIIQKMLKPLAAEVNFENARKLTRILGREMSPNDRLLAILRQIDPEERTLDIFAGALKGIQLFQSGGSVQGGQGQPVPVIAHAGEWILNKSQQEKLAQSLGMGLEQIKMWLFGTNMGQGKPGPQTTGTKPTTKEQGFRGTFFNLVPQVDPNGVVIWFIEMDDGSFGQVSPRDARRIKQSNGEWIPNYVKRSTHGFTQKFLPPQLGRGLAKGGVVMSSFAKGGVVSPSFSLGNIVQSFAEGGTVLSQIGGITPSMSSKEINQNFEVHTQGETDWNYVLRLSALHAQESF